MKGGKYVKISILMLISCVIGIGTLLTGCGSITTTPQNTLIDQSSSLIKPTSTVSESPKSHVVTDPISLSGISMETKDIGWATSWRDSGLMLYRTSSGGKTWSDISPSFLKGNQGINFQFIDANTAWIAVPNQGDGKQKNSSIELYRTTDGGHRWEKISNLPMDFVIPIQSIQIDMIDQTSGFIMTQPEHGMNSEPGELFKTQNGGKTWEAVASSGMLQNSGAIPFGGRIDFLNQQIGWLAGGNCSTCLGSLYKTQDGGVNWQNVNVDPPTGLTGSFASSSFEFTNSNHVKGIFVLPLQEQNKGIDQTAFYETKDSGKTWSINGRIATIGASIFPTENIGYLAAINNQLYKTMDSAKNWTLIQSKNLSAFLPKDKNIKQIDFISENDGWLVVGNKGIMQGTTLLKTSDGGQTWTQVF